MTIELYQTAHSTCSQKVRITLAEKGYGVFVSALLISGFIAALYNNTLWLQQTVLVVTLAYTLWVLVGIWRSPPSETSVWWVVARALTVAWAVNTVLVTGFLQLNILETAFGL